MQQSIGQVASVHFAGLVYGLAGVHAVYANYGEESLHLWTIVDKDSFDLRRQVYDTEAEFYAQAPYVRVDFYVLTLERLPEKKSLKSTIPRGFELVPRQATDALEPAASG